MRAILGKDLHTHGAFVLEDHLFDSHLFMHLDAVAAGVVEHHLIETTALDLPGARAFAGDGFGKVEWHGFLPTGRHEADAVLDGERRGAQLRQQPKPVEDAVGVRDEGFADVIAREFRLLEDNATVSLAGEERGQSRAARTSADDDDVVVAGGTEGWVGAHAGFDTPT